MPESGVTVRVIAPGIGMIEWTAAPAAEALARTLGTVSDDALVGQGLRRLEASVPASDTIARRALQRAGYRLEGLRRQAVAVAENRYEDVALYARLIDDVTVGPGAFSSVLNTVLPRKRLIAHVVMRDDAGRLVLCETTFKPDWELPGGIVEAGETPREAATREIMEELGVDWSLGPLLAVDWMPPYLGWEDALEMIFDGGRVTPAQLAEFTPDGREIATVGLVTLAEAAELVTPLSHRRLSVIMSLAPGEVAYLENGRRVG